MENWKSITVNIKQNQPTFFDDKKIKQNCFEE